MIKLCDEWIEIYFDTSNYDLATKMLEDFKTYKAPEKERSMK